jgi:hypothetical protein
MYKIINNFFNDEEINIILKNIKDTEDQAPGKVYRQTGRKIVGLDNLDKKIINKVEVFINQFYNKKLIVKDIGFMRFKKEYGTPKLLPHKDDYACEVVFDYQVKTNKKWDLFIEGQRIELKDNDAVCFEGEQEAHWREKTIFNDDEFVEMICFNCIGENHWRHNSEINPMNEIDQAKRMQQTFKDWSHIYSK